MGEVFEGEIHEKVWGHELWIANNGSYCGKRLTLKKKFQCSLHCHELKHETFFVQSGIVHMEVGANAVFMTPGDSIVIEPGVLHRFTGLAETNEIFEFSTHHEESDSYRTVTSRQIEDSEFLHLLEAFGRHCSKKDK